MWFEGVVWWKIWSNLEVVMVKKKMEARPFVMVGAKDANMRRLNQWLKVSQVIRIDGVERIS